MHKRILLSSQKSMKSFVTWLPWPSRIRSCYLRRAFALVSRSNTCSSHANPIPLLLHPEGELPQKTWCFPASMTFTQLD
jgi:hypothetical protein